MKFGSIFENGKSRLIIKIDEKYACKLSEMEQLINCTPSKDMLDLITYIEKEKKLLLEFQKNLNNVKKIRIQDFNWLPPIQRPSKILGVAFNNKELMKKAHKDPGVPNFFLKPPSALQGHNKPIIVDPKWGAVIPEPEICAVISKKAKHISSKEALNYVFGFLIHNDVTSHGLKFQKDSIAITYDSDLARPEFYTWRNLNGPDDTDAFYVYHTRSKGTDTFGPMGPWITTSDEIRNPNKLSITGSLNEEYFTIDHTSNYRFSIEECISEASSYFTLEPGDIISFGTTGKGTGKFPRGHKSLLIGENTGTINISIENLGKLSNPIKHQTGGA